MTCHFRLPPEPDDDSGGDARLRATVETHT